MATQSYQNIADYIANNPANWEKDKFYVGNSKDLLNADFAYKGI
jgi:hypothetical protein